MALMSTKNGKVYAGDRMLKPLARNSQELHFYESVSEKLPQLAPFVLKFHGLESREEDHIVLENPFHGMVKPGMLEVKLSVQKENGEASDLLRAGVGNLLGCYVYAVECKNLVFLTGVNAFQGKQQPVDHFDRTVRLFFAKMGSYPNLITRLHTLINVLKNLKGMRFVNASAVFVFDQEDRNREPKLFFTHFDRVTYDENFEPDTDIVRSLRHLLYMMRTEWGEKVPTVYLIRHGERQDYCDKEWAPKSTHPHDAPLSPAGVVQSHDLVDRLCNIRPHLIVSSPFQRAIMFLEPLARRLQTSIVVEPGICEFLCQKTRKRMPRFISDTVTISPWLDTEYVPYWKTLTLETWEKVFDRTKETVDHLLKECEGKGDLVIVSHRSTLQTVFACIVPNFTGDTKLEYAGTAMLVRDVDGTWIVQTFNELNYLQHRIESPSSNPWRHIEGYYEDMDWNLYKSTSKMDAHPTAAAK